MAYTVLETTDCTNCVSDNDALAGEEVDVTATGNSDTGTAVSGSFNNPSTTYSGTEGTSTICIYENGAYADDTDASSFASRPCNRNMDVHFAKTVTTTNEYATAYLGMALGNG